VKAFLKIIPVATVDEVLRLALTRPLTPIDWTEEDQLAEERQALRQDGGEGARPH
jgi:ATP-dependent Lon protease